MVVAPLPVDRFRIVATVDEAPHDPDITFVQGLLDERGPQSHPVVVEEVVWGPVSASTTGGSTSPQGTV